MAKKVSLTVAKKKFAVRCSSLPLFFSCPNALLNPDKLTVVDVEFSASKLGTDIHAAIQHAVETGEINLRKIERMNNPADVERAKMLFHNGLSVVQQARVDMKNPQFEVEVAFETEHYSLTGHIDILDAGPSVAYIIDFKTGRTRDDHYHQMLGYAVGAWTKVGRPDKYEVNIAYAYLEDKGDITAFTVNAADMREWLRELDALHSRYTINRRCIYCPLQNTCKPFRDYLKGSVATVNLFVAGSDNPKRVNVRQMSETERAKLATGIKMADSAVKRVREHIKDEAIKNGEIDTGNGNKFIIKARTNRTLLVSKALPIVAQFVTAKDIAKATTLSLHSLVTAAASRVKGGMKNVVRDELTKALEKGGAILTSESNYLETVNAKGKAWPKSKKKPSPKGS